MGVKDLWGIVSPTSELIKLQDIEEKIIAIDLSCWVCDSQNVNMGSSVIRPHLRNLLFRAISIAKAGILPVFVLEGEAPCMKLQTIQNRITKHSKNPPKNPGSGSRSRLKGLLSQCQELLTILGLPWIQAVGEAEATCAALSYHNLVDGVITQDSDVFLYGAEVVFRNFSGNQQKTTVEKYKLSAFEKKLGLGREVMICLALLLGCDYLPAGVPGVGKENALQLLKYWNSCEITQPLQRLQNWTKSSSPQQLSGKEKQRKSDRPIEEIIKEKALKTPGFPFKGVAEEFLIKLDKPKVKIKWEFPQVFKLVNWCIKMLGWEPEYAFEKAIPLATLWIISFSIPNDADFLKPLEVTRKRVQQGIPSFEVIWELSKESHQLLPEGLPTKIKTIEPSHLLMESFPSVIEDYENSALLKKKGNAKMKRTTKKRAKVIEDKENVFALSRTVQKNSHETTHDDNCSDESVDEAELSNIINNLVNMKVGHSNNDENKENMKNRLPACSDKLNNQLNASISNCDNGSTDKKIKNKFVCSKPILTQRQLTLDRYCINTKILGGLSKPLEQSFNPSLGPPILKEYKGETFMDEKEKDISIINISSDFEDCSFVVNGKSDDINCNKPIHSFSVSTPTIPHNNLSEGLTHRKVLDLETSCFEDDYDPQGVKLTQSRSKSLYKKESIVSSELEHECGSSTNESKDLFDDSDLSNNCSRTLCTNLNKMENACLTSNTSALDSNVKLGLLTDKSKCNVEPSKTVACNSKVVGHIDEATKRLSDSISSSDIGLNLKEELPTFKVNLARTTVNSINNAVSKSSFEESFSVPCFQLLDSFSNLSIRSVSTPTPVVRPKISNEPDEKLVINPYHQCDDETSQNFSNCETDLLKCSTPEKNTNAGFNAPEKSANAAFDTIKKCSNATFDTPEKSTNAAFDTPEKSTNAAFDTPKIETLSLAERMRRKFHGGMDEVLDCI